MKAAEARALNVGQWVTAGFGLYTKQCEIMAIDWPTFTLRTKDHRGFEMIRTRRYQSLGCKIDRPATRPNNLPSWLSWPAGKASER